MYLKINPITNLKYQTLKANTKAKEKPIEEEQNNSQKTFAYNYMTFKSALKVRKPAFANKNIEKISNKMISLFKALPDCSAIKKPITLPYENGTVGFLVDKTNSEHSKIYIKFKDNSTKIKNWDSLSEFDRGMDMVINKKGQMIEGVYYEAGGCHLLFRRLAKNTRRIIYKHNQYIPTNIEKYSWERISAGEKIFSTHEKIFVDQDKPEIIFFEMAERSTSLLAEK